MRPTASIPSTDLNKGGLAPSTSCTETEPNQPRVAPPPPPLYDDVIRNQSPHGDARRPRAPRTRTWGRSSAPSRDIPTFALPPLLAQSANMSNKSVRCCCLLSPTLRFALVWAACAAAGGGGDVGASRGRSSCCVGSASGFISSSCGR